VSVDVALPNFPSEVVDDVLAVLAAIAARRHGDAAVIRALARPERSTRSASAF
jgi:hypothetical protein